MNLGRRDISDALHDVLGFSDSLLERRVRDIVRQVQDPQIVQADFQNAFSINSDLAAQLWDRLDKSRALKALEEEEEEDEQQQPNKKPKLDTPPDHSKETPQEPSRSQTSSAVTSGAMEIENVSLLAKMSREEKYKSDPLYLVKLREETRKEYLKGREVSQIELAERIARERELWYSTTPDIVDSTNIMAHKAEKERIEMAKQIRDERIASSTLDAYEMPDNYDEDQVKRLTIAKAKMAEPVNPLSHRQKPLSDMEIWEQQQLASALTHSGAKDKKLTTKQQLITTEGDIIDFVPDIVANNQLVNREDEWWNKTVEEREAARLSEVLAKRERLQKDRESLPVYHFRTDLLKAIRDHTVLIVVGETGSGKTTQIPQFLDEVGYSKLGKIGCTQPRRVAAMSVAARVAEEKGVRLGRDVGYVIRFENCTTDITRINYMTDGMLLQQFLAEPELTSYSCVMIDEAHERTLHTDILFGLVKDIARHRAKDFKLIISSATLEAAKFAAYFDDAPIFRVPGRKFEVQIYYTKSPEANFIDASVITILQIHKTQPLGDVLVFLPGQQEIEECHEELVNRMKGAGPAVKELRVLTIYSALPSDQQAKIFAPTPANARKVVLATNIAETSITIDNVVYVIDPGLVKQNSYNPKTGMEALITVPCSRASANQRAGRAGRVRPGKCFRLYPKVSYEKEMSESNVPEIQRSNIAQVVLALKALGIDDLLHFDFLDPPATDSLIKALELLYALGGLNDLGQLTKVGRQMSQLPGNPQLAKMMIKSAEYECVEECLVIASMLEVANMIFYRPKERQIHADNARKTFFRPGGDHLTLLNVYRQWESSNFDVRWCYENYVQHRSLQRARDIYEQFTGLVDKVELDLSTSPHDVDGIRKAITAGYFMQAAKLTKAGQYRTIKHQQTVDIHPHSSLFFSTTSSSEKNGYSATSSGQQKTLYRPDTLIYDELVLTTKEFMRNVIEINPKWLLEVAPHYFRDKQEIIKTAKLPKLARAS